MKILAWAVVGALGTLGAAAGCAADDKDGPGAGGVPDAIAAAISAALDGDALVGSDALEIDHRLRQPSYAAPVGASVTLAGCQRVEDALNKMCELGPIPGQSCSGQATFFMANDQPRCHARVELYAVDYTGAESDPMSTIYELDLTGAAVFGDVETCGDGVVDEAEACDDGNREPWDGCDPQCKIEEFTGCEIAIEDEFEKANVAWIDRLDWASPRSHTMVHKAAQALRTPSAALCTDARVAAAAACTRIQTDMPFVSWCDARVETLANGTSCAVRLQVGFSRLAPDYGVFTTGLTGLLSFTIH